MAEYNPNIDLIFEKYKTLNMFITDNYSENKPSNITNDSNKILDNYDEKISKIDTATLGTIINKNKFTPDKPFRTDFFSANKQQAELAIETQRKEPAKVNNFILNQQLLAAMDKGINIINPLLLTNAIPGEGILTTKIGYPQIGYESIVNRIDNGPVDKTKRLLASNNDLILGQEEGIKLSSIRTIGDLINKGSAALVNLFSTQIKKNNVVLKATEATFEKRLDQNDLTPKNGNSEYDVYSAVYARKYISNISQKVLSDGFSPITQASNSPKLLSTDTNALFGLEDIFKNNALKDNTLNNLNYDGEQYEPDLDVKIFSNEEPKKILFPFYMESLNSLQDDTEKFITFQATFSNLKEKYSPQWSDQNYFGRNTNPKLYSNTTRTLNFDFVIWSKNRFDIALIKQRVNWLIKHCYPKYITVGDDEKIKILSEGPVISITIGDIFKNVSGIITDLDIDWDMEGNNRWELSESVIMLQMVKITISFEAIFNKFMENKDVQNSVDVNQNISSDFYPAININNLKKRKFKFNVQDEDALSDTIPSNFG